MKRRKLMQKVFAASAPDFGMIKTRGDQPMSDPRAATESENGRNKG